MSKIIDGNVGPQQGPGPGMEDREQMAELARLIRSADDVRCDRCGASNFINVYKIRKISGIMTGTGRDMVVPVPVYACADCGYINENFLKGVGLDRDKTESEGPKSPDSNTATEENQEK